MASRPLTLFLFIPLLVLHAPVLGKQDNTVGISVHPDSLSVVAERKAAFLINCSVSSDHEFTPLNFTWLKNGEVIVENKKVNILRNGSLYFKRIVQRRNKSARSPEKRQGRSDSGWYECYATNKIGTVFVRRVHLEVVDSGKKKVECSPESQTHPVGDVARFHCHIEGVQYPNYVWHKEGRPLTHGPRFKKFSGVLQIQDLKKSDAGLYICISIQEKAVHTSKEARLEVKGVMDRRAPRIVAGPVNVTVNVNSPQTVILECLAEGNPKPNITWMRKDKVPISHAKKTSMGNLEFYSVEASHEGTYVCTASNALGFDTSTGYLAVIVPPVISSPAVTETIAYVLDIPVKCTALGKPTPTLRWLKDGKELVNSDRIWINYEGNLLVRESKFSDAGYYQCIVNNSAGYATLISRIDITKAEGSPTSAPINVKKTVLSETDVRLTWQPPELPSPLPEFWYLITQYIVDEDDNPQDWYHTYVARENSYTVNGLKPHTTFSFHVRVWNPRGGGPPSPVIHATTHESVPTTYPKILDLKTPTPTSILVTWKPLTPAEARGNIVHYLIYYKHGGATKEAEVSPDKSSYTLTNLKPNTLYLIRVLGGTSKGFPKVDVLDWPWERQHTPKAPSESGSLNLEVHWLNNTAVFATWTIPEMQRKDVTGFILIVETSVGAEQFGPYPIPPSKDSYILTNLKNNTYYQVTLEASSQSGISWSKTKTVAPQPPVDLPPPPLELDGEALSSTSIEVKWKSPQTILAIQSYTINYTVTNGPDLKPNLTTSKVMQRTSEGAVINGLMPFTSYRISVQSRTHNSAGEFSNPIFVTTDEDVPGAPESVTWSIRAPTEVRITWHLPHQPNGQVTGYEIFYTSQQKPNGKVDWNVIKQNGSDTSQDVTGLDKKQYLFKVRAFTSKGEGNFSAVVSVKIPGSGPHGFSTTSSAAITPDTNESENHKIELIAGLVIAVVIIIICVVVIVRRRCFNACGPGYPHSSSNHQPPICSGNGSVNHHSSGHANGHAVQVPLDGVEMDTYVNMLQTLPENKHLDAKGGGNMVIQAPGYKNGITRPAHNGHMHNNRHAVEEDSKATEPLLKGRPDEDPVSKGRSHSKDRTLGDSLEDIDHGDADLSQHGDGDLDDSSTPLVSKSAREGSKPSRGNATPPGDGGPHLRKGANCVTNPSAIPPGISMPSNQGSAVPADSGPQGAGWEAEFEEEPTGGGVSAASGQLSGRLEDKPNLPLSQHQSNQTSHYTPRGRTGGNSAPPLAPPPLAGSSSSSPPSDVTFTSASIPHGAPTNVMAAEQIHSLQHTGHLSDSMFSQRLPAADSTAAQECIGRPTEAPSSRLGSDAAVVDDVQLSLKPNDLASPLAATLDGTSAADNSRQANA